MSSMDLSVSPYRSKRARPSTKRYPKRNFKAKFYRQPFSQTEFVTAIQKASLNMSVNSTSGFNSTSQSLNFLFNQNNVQYTFNGTTFSSVTSFQNAGNFDQIYDEYRILRVRMRMYFSANSNAIGAAAPNFPIVYMVEDSDDTNTLTSAQACLAYDTCKVIQLGTTSKGGAQYFSVRRPCVQTSVATNVATGTTAISQLTKSPWLNTDSNNIPHLGVKAWIDLLTTFTGYDGTMTFIFEVEQQYKHTR